MREKKSQGQEEEMSIEDFSISDSEREIMTVTGATVSRGRQQAMRIKDVSFLEVDVYDADQLEMTRRAVGTLVVTEDAPAIDVAAAAEALGSRVVICVDKKDRATGVFVPAEVKVRLARNLQIRTDKLADGLQALEVMPGERERQFRHELFNRARPRLVWCAVGSHYSFVPCPDHG